MHTRIHGLSGIQTHDPSVRTNEDSSCLRQRGHCDRLIVDYRIRKENTQAQLRVVAIRLHQYFFGFVYSRINHSLPYRTGQVCNGIITSYKRICFPCHILLKSKMKYGCKRRESMMCFTMHERHFLITFRIRIERSRKPGL
jgi:hypothetical protein